MGGGVYICICVSVCVFGSRCGIGGVILVLGLFLRLLLLKMLLLPFRFQLFVFAVAALAGAYGALEGLFVYDSLIGEGFEDGFVFLAFAALGGGFRGWGHAGFCVEVCCCGAVFGAGAVVWVVVVGWERSGATQVFP